VFVLEYLINASKMKKYFKLVVEHAHNINS
jgi:hypothetical protein